MRSLIVIAGAMFLCGSTASTETYLVRPDGTGDFPTIQAAIDSAVVGDIIELADGTFTGVGNRDIDYLGKAITVRSQSGNPDACVLACNYEGRGFIFQSGEGSDSVVEGVTVLAGSAGCGAGMRCTASSPTITRCIFLAGYASQGAGVCCTDASSPEITHCVFRYGIATYWGGGILFSYSDGEVSDCLFVDNTADSDGGGINCYTSETIALTRCTFIRNSATNRGGGIDASNADASFFNCTFYANDSPYGSGITCPHTITMQNTIVAFGLQGEGVRCGAIGEATVTCSNIFGNEGGNWTSCLEDRYGILGNISENPLFCDPENDDLTLAEDSPCAPFTPPNEQCYLIGAWPVGCGPASVPDIAEDPIGITWGEIKARFRN